jgi:putative endonuclease
MATFTYVHIPQSEKIRNASALAARRDLRERLTRHNNGKIPQHSKMEALADQTYIPFSDSKRATELEHYLKSASGRAFLKKRP